MFLNGFLITNLSFGCWFVVGLLLLVLRWLVVVGCCWLIDVELVLVFFEEEKWREGVGVV